MIRKFDARVTKTGLKALGTWQRVAFGAFLLERAIPNFLQFQVETGAVGGGVLRAALGQLWNNIEHDGARRSTYITPEMCSAVAPDTESHTSIYTSSALDAATIAEYQLRYAQNGDLDLLTASAELRRDSIDIFLQNSERIDPTRPDFEMYLLSRPLMQEELNQQHADLAFLANTSSEQKIAWRQALSRAIDLGFGQFRMKA